MSRAAITPSDAGSPPAGVAIGPTVADCVERFTAPAQHPVNVAHRERSMRAVDLGLRIANDAVREVIASNAVVVSLSDVYWFDTTQSTMEEQELGGFFTREEIVDSRQRIDEAIRYIELRGPDAFPVRFIRHPEQPHLVRFEAKP